MNNGRRSALPRAIQSAHHRAAAKTETELRIVRIEAALRDETGLNRHELFCLLAGVSDQLRIENGPWYGHLYSDNAKYPFMLMRPFNEIFWGYEEHATDFTNLGERTIQIGEMFSYSAYVYEIINVDLIALSDHPVA
jgi:hypothetical protein